MGRPKTIDDSDYAHPFIPPVDNIRGCAERWRQYKGTAYWVSDAGRVYTTKRNRLCEPKYSKKKQGYVIHIRELNGATPSIMRMVWECFNGEIPKGYYVKNKDGYKSVADLSSLILVSSKEHYAQMGSNNRERRRVIDLDTGKIYKNVDEFAKTKFYSRNYMLNVLAGYYYSPYINAKYEGD